MYMFILYIINFRILDLTRNNNNNNNDNNEINVTI